MQSFLRYTQNIVKGLIYTIQNLIRRSQLDTGHLECITNQLMSDLLWLQGIAARSPSLMRCPGYGGDFGGCGKFSWQRVLLLALSRLWGVDPKSSARCARASPSWIYPAGKLQWHFTCGLDFGHSLWLPFKAVFVVVKGLLIVPVGTMGLCWRGDSPFQTARGGGGGGACGLWACGLARLSFRGLSCCDTLAAFAVLEGLLRVPVGTMGLC